MYASKNLIINIELVNLFINNDAKINIKDGSGKTPLEFAQNALHAFDNIGIGLGKYKDALRAPLPVKY